MTSKDKINSIVGQMQSTGGDCVVCGALTRDIDGFVPYQNKGWIFGEPEEGKIRMCFVFLCQKCEASKHGKDIVEFNLSYNGIQQ